MVESAASVPEVIEAPNGCADRLQELAARPIDITSTAPVRLALYRTGNTSHTLAVVAHHAVLDGLSVVPLYRDLTEAFEARRRGTEPGWSPVRMRYTDYARWQRELLGDSSEPGSRAHEDLAYWTERLETAPQVLELPSDRSRSGEYGSAAAGTVTFTIPAELHAALEKVALEYDATPFMVVHAALVVLLARLSGSDDVSVGTPVSDAADPACTTWWECWSARSCCAPPSIRLVPSSICSAGSAATTSTRSLMRRRRSTRSSHAWHREPRVHTTLCSR
ncbi:hypothetical protein GS426_20115 [Rhodococcus hoagii]|nr:hypothetical protein [Prescottella equi]